LAGQFTSGPSSVGPLPVIQRLDATHTSLSYRPTPVGDSTEPVGDENKIHIQLLVATLLVADTALGVGGQNRPGSICPSSSHWGPHSAGV